MTNQTKTVFTLKEKNEVNINVKGYSEEEGIGLDKVITVCRTT